MIKKNFHILIMGIVALFIICGFIISGINSKRLIKYTKYTTAIIKSDWHHKNNTGVGVDYEYSVNGKGYEFTINLDLKKNEKYLLAYDSLKPSNCQILEIYPLSKNIISPVNGWNLNEIPVKVNSEEIFNYINEIK